MWGLGRRLRHINLRWRRCKFNGFQCNLGRIGTNGTTGQGFELQAGDSTNNRILAYNRTGAAYLNMNLDALSYSLKVSGTEKGT